MQKATATHKTEGAADRKRKADEGKQRTEVTVFDSALFGPKPLKMQVRFKAKYYDVEVYSRIADSSCVVYYTASGCYEGLDSVFLWDAKRRQLTGDDGELIDTRKKPKASKTTGSPKTPNGVLKKDAGVAPAPIDTRAIPKKTSTVGAPPRPLPLFEQGDRVELQSGGDAGDHIITSISAGKRKCTITPLTGGEPLQVLTSQLLPVETEVVVVAECVRVFPGLFREFKHIKTSTVIEALDAASMVESAAKTILLRQQNELDLAGGADIPGVGPCRAGDRRRSTEDERVRKGGCSRCCTRGASGSARCIWTEAAAVAAQAWVQVVAAAPTAAAALVAMTALPAGGLDLQAYYSSFSSPRRRLQATSLL